MKKTIIAITVMLVAVMTYATQVRVVERISDIDGDATIDVTDYSRVISIVCDVTVASQTNTFVTTSTGIFTSGGTAYTNTYELAPSVVAVQGAEVVAWFNQDADTDDETQWLKPSDVITLTGSTTCVYRVVLEKAD